MVTTLARRIGAVLSLAILLGSPAAIAVRPPEPRRIVSTSPSITETLFALKLGDRVVGVSTYCRFPAEVLKLPKVGTFLKPEAEKIAALRPDLVIVNALGNGIDRRLQSLRIPFVVVQGGSMPSIFSSIRQIASASGVPERGDALVTDLQQRLEAIRSRYRSQPRPRMLMVVGRRPGMLADLVVAGPGTYLNELIDVAGGLNVMNIPGQPQYPKISLETVLRLDPDVILDTVDMGETDVQRRERRTANERLWADYTYLRAVQAKRVYADTTDALVVPGPRVIEAAEWIAALLHTPPGAPRE